MRKTATRYIYIIALFLCAQHIYAQDRFPDGTLIPDWFRDDRSAAIPAKAKFCITDYGVLQDSSVLQTAAIQKVIDLAASLDGGMIVIPKGTFLSGSLFFRPNTHLYLEEGAVIKGSDDISDFALLPTRMEGQTVKYFAALVNADGVDGFSISGKGTLDGNGFRYWRAFWLRRQSSVKGTNMDEMRPRLVYVSNSKDVHLSGITMRNSPFWTSHFYRCENVKLVQLHIFAPEKPVKAPSSDAIDLDNCTNVLIKHCYISVNDDAVALKGGKGPFADKEVDNGPNKNIVIEDCTFGFCHSVLTCGSESVHSHNIILRRSSVDGAQRLFQLKMRPDTPQLYENILVEDITGSARSMISIKPWTQFFDLKGEKEIRMSYANNITLRNIEFACETLFDVTDSEQYVLSDFTFENFNIRASTSGVIHSNYIRGLTMKNVLVNGEAQE